MPERPPPVGVLMVRVTSSAQVKKPGGPARCQRDGLTAMHNSEDRALQSGVAMWGTTPETTPLGDLQHLGHAANDIVDVERLADEIVRARHL